MYYPNPFLHFSEVALIFAYEKSEELRHSNLSFYYNNCEKKKFLRPSRKILLAVCAMVKKWHVLNKPSLLDYRYTLFELESGKILKNPKLMNWELY